MIFCFTGPGPGAMGGVNFTGDMPNFEQGNVIRSREIMYRLIISQLFYDGYSQAAIQLTNMLAVDPPCPPSERLLNVLVKGLERESEEKNAQERANKKNMMIDLSSQMSRSDILESLQGTGLNLEYATESNQIGQDAAPEPALYETAYVTSHKVTFIFIYKMN